MPRRPPDPRQLGLEILLPSAKSTRAELVDQQKKAVRKKKRADFSAWPKTGTRVLVHYEEEGMEPNTEPGEVVSANRWDPARGTYCIVRLDRADAAPVTVDRLGQISPEEK